MFRCFATLVLLMTLSIPSVDAFFLPEGGTFQASDGTIVEIERNYTTRDRLRLDRAMEIYREYVHQGVGGLIEPTIYDPQSIDLYLTHSYPPRPAQEKQDPLSTTDYVKKETDVISAQSISRQQRMALRRSQKIGKCWRDPLLSSKLYAMCLQFIKGTTPKRTMGLESDTSPAARHAAPK